MTVPPAPPTLSAPSALAVTCSLLTMTPESTVAPPPGSQSPVLSGFLGLGELWKTGPRGRLAPACPRNPPKTPPEKPGHYWSLRVKLYRVGAGNGYDLGPRRRSSAGRAPPW